MTTYIVDPNTKRVIEKIRAWKHTHNGELPKRRSAEPTEENRLAVHLHKLTMRCNRGLGGDKPSERPLNPVEVALFKDAVTAVVAPSARTHIKRNSRAASSSSSIDDTPQLGDRILLFQEEWLDSIVEGRKTLELRHQCLRAGKVWLGYKKQIYAVAHMEQGYVIHTLKEFRRLVHKHRMNTESMPYKRTCAMRVTNVHRIDPIAYKHPPGAQGVVKYQPVESQYVSPEHETA